MIVKERFSKKYRVAELDKHIRKSHTKAEVAALKKCQKKGISCPAVVDSDLEKGLILMTKIQGVTIKHFLDKSEYSDGQNSGPLVSIFGRHGL